MAVDSKSNFGEYWAAYGGWKAIRSSSYLRAALVLTFLQCRAWTQPGWWDLVIQVLPNLIGFALGGYTIMLSFGDDKFQKLLAKAGKHQPVYMAVSATFAHFVLVQFVALGAALVFRSLHSEPLWFLASSLGFNSATGYAIAVVAWGFGYLLFMYSLACGIAATLEVFRCSRWFCAHQLSDSKKDGDDSNSNAGS